MTIKRTHLYALALLGVGVSLLVYADGTARKKEIKRLSGEFYLPDYDVTVKEIEKRRKKEKAAMNPVIRKLIGSVNRNDVAEELCREKKREKRASWRYTLKKTFGFKRKSQNFQHDSNQQRPVSRGIVCADETRVVPNKASHKSSTLSCLFPWARAK
ncbi:MAG: hypothetical protein Q8Q25_00620 [bacterium]|nr:hypothetical protein [bacterium]